MALTRLVFSVVFFVIFYLFLLCLAQDERKINPKCPPFSCGLLGEIGFPFSNRTHPECGLCIVDDCDKTFQKIQLWNHGPQFYVLSISQDNMVTLRDQEHPNQLDGHDCGSLKRLSIPISPFLSFEIPYNQNVFQCPLTYNKPKDFGWACNDSKHLFLYYLPTAKLPDLLPQCLHIPFSVNKTRQSVEYVNLSTYAFALGVNVTKECLSCYKEGGQCQTDGEGKFNCSVTARTGKGNLAMKLGLGLGVGVGGSGLIAVLSFIIWRRKKQRCNPTIFNSRDCSSDPSSRSELEVGGAYFGVPIFSYSELAKATNNFSHEKELGDGGFGTVYYAKLRDGREVAVKRLYEHNYRRVEQFMNEVEILTRLRHKNLVSLYGCTSRFSQQGLLLVYEYVPNGTVADHLHGNLEKPGSLTWPIRMKIAIETASALAYLHASDIIHRDVKTNNILLDSNFCVKVADFGLSRLFPTDVTHVSTAPQGSPGYVDPEYHQCYQLTDRSDVYSFGVVLVELISSMPAVDINRHRHEINLANLAINRIRKHAIEELFDPLLGYQSDEEVQRMLTSVAELAYLCLQQNKEMRPPMDVILEELKRIQNREWKLEDVRDEKGDNEMPKNMHPPPSPSDCDNLALLKHIRLPSSPISVTAKWVSNNTTPNVSG
ncbi:LEAF RUST 10 DISEASE-RESISTANCE LOCUS RECEPTOR-LIKE PROTEIN KINASE-like 1.1 isoform X2 [Mangifera indica]|uniref:LEAF RUST 10 DISEASE-RESISTANCE LOCUS RECEPTOR-LIKE PROTEIN KINASE-like 1.1 isoform X2 n=1 Tax=Mangifera indica TaxID=29780 RepID=UPI001CFAC68F|nr:LEAF RUST 10 DISEASE-RESISTANCE LOCUS RECEPTOR-LIKE PROTEIN KINASE-like 1.1 isoform X2 [Mangifera indica]XP_044493469.1 LEAF RUST 10 DISEASE-RESISTANCE LOCUS RECEPTOR-LIKE PROTEIN KINASE-like 1.1 isoform X2 [Mangifera indica]XP_044493470.1 LEAF RUST 10 DISEASE-RESISTANCE LOCUS RECEPTOR-LIKE PROTEIN KINASE-like 1.1 isoform X2 [Mangifera indica]